MVLYPIEKIGIGFGKDFLEPEEFAYIVYLCFCLD